MQVCQWTDISQQVTCDSKMLFVIQKTCKMSLTILGVTRTEQDTNRLRLEFLPFCNYDQHHHQWWSIITPDFTVMIAVTTMVTTTNINTTTTMDTTINYQPKPKPRSTDVVVAARAAQERS